MLVTALTASIAMGKATAGDGATTPRADLPATSRSTSSASTTSATTPPSATTGESAPTGAAESTDGPSTTASAPTSPSAATSLPGIDTPGITMTVTPRQNGDLDVRQVARLTAPVTSVQVAPPDVSTAGSEFAAETPKLTGLGLQADGRDVELPSSTVTTSTTISLPVASTTFLATYTLRGAVHSSQPSVAGRALGALRPLDLGAEPTAPVDVDVSGRSVLAIACPELGGIGETNCAGATSAGYSLSSPVPISSALVLLQLNLNRAS